MTDTTKLQCLTTSIERLSHDGRGITHINDKVTFVERALEGESIAYQYLRRHNKFDEAKATAIHQASPDRVTPGCPHYEICGGCNLQHMNHQRQVTFKQQVLLEQLQQFGNVSATTVLPALSADIWGYRRKARLSARYLAAKDLMLVGFRERNGRYVAIMDSCEVLHPSVGQRLTDLQQLIHGMENRRHIAQIEVAIGDTETALVIRHLQPLTAVETEQFCQFADQHDFHLYLQPGKLKSIHKVWPPESHDLLSYKLADYDLTLAFHPTDFTQVNAAMNRLMIKQALDLLQPEKTDRILDLFCGLGNFTLPLATLAGHVTGVEVSQAMVERGQYNATCNQLTNVDFYPADLTQNCREAPFMQHKYDKILLDPPRSGAKAILPLVNHLAAEKIVYVSCNPATLARDAGILVHEFGYHLEAIGLLDMFPQTNHIEAMAYFTRHQPKT